MVGGFLRRSVAQKLGERATVAATPGNAALAGNALEVADQDHAEVRDRPNRRPRGEKATNCASVAHADADWQSPFARVGEIDRRIVWD